MVGCSRFGSTRTALSDGRRGRGDGAEWRGCCSAKSKGSKSSCWARWGYVFRKGINCKAKESDYSIPGSEFGGGAHYTSGVEFTGPASCRSSKYFGEATGGCFLSAQAVGSAPVGYCGPLEAGSRCGRSKALEKPSTDDWDSFEPAFDSGASCRTSAPSRAGGRIRKNSQRPRLPQLQEQCLPSLQRLLSWCLI